MPTSFVFRIRKSGHTCDFTPCSTKPCLNGGECTLQGDTYKCNCPPGYFGVNCENTPCHGNPCLHGTCGHYGDTFKCHCPEGYSGDTCEVTPCTGDPCNNKGKAHLMSSTEIGDRIFCGRILSPT